MIFSSSMSWYYIASLSWCFSITCPALLYDGGVTSKYQISRNKSDKRCIKQIINHYWIIPIQKNLTIIDVYHVY